MPATSPAPNATTRHPLHVSVESLADLWHQSVVWMLSHAVQVAIAGAIGFALVMVMLAIRHLGERLCLKRETLLNGWGRTAGRVISATQLWFMVLFACKLLDGYADPPAALAATISTLFTIAAALQGAIWVREFILGVVEHRAGGESHAALSSAIGIIRLLVTVILYAIALVLILDNLGVNVTGLVAGLGIGGIAIGLAAKGIFDDLFSALSIIFDRPFQRGDAIQWDKTNGTVEAIGLKTTRVRSVTGEEVVISNTNLLNKELHNLARLDRRRIVTTLSIAAYTPPDICATIPALAKKVVERHPKCRLVRCGLTTFGASSLDFELQYDVASQLYDEVFSARNDVSIDLLRAFADTGIDWAWPTQATIAADADGRPSGVGPVEKTDPAKAPAVDQPTGQESTPIVHPTSKELAPE